MRNLILWFRRDLRLADNPAFAWAVKQRAGIIPVYLYAPKEEEPWVPGAASRWWLHHSLAALSKGLRARGLRLSCYRGDSIQILKTLAEDAKACTLVANRLHDPHLEQRDRALEKALSGQGIDIRFFDSELLFTPGTLNNQQDKPYRVFTAFWRKARALLEVEPPVAVSTLPKGRLLSASAGDTDTDSSVESLGLLDINPWHNKLHDHWCPGEENAHRQLQRFLENGLSDYQKRRDYPAITGSSRLSPHFHFGEITTRQVVRILLSRVTSANAETRKSIECFLSELGWREFSHHLLWHFPDSSRQSMNPKFADAFWRRNNAELRAWQLGNTGVALVDAGMKELWETGWMHNRVRMIVGSFLTKNLGLHWRAGAEWFWDTLVDADLANNSLGWQWIAGCGVDAAPYYRIFNPDTQAKRFDPERAYIRKWLGGISQRPPIVDLSESRKQALARYRQHS
ncbi:MAG: deoxyribodipyrimidine photo-lyase [Gammaproteobacteria bacterium]|nr:deoxyribodipyrimidine photo-lyase [Gammaproteobacteria bacterium]